MSKQATGFNQPEIDIDVLMGRKPIPTSGTQPQAPVTQNGSGSAIDMDVLMGRKPIPTAGDQPEPSKSSEIGEIPNNPDAAFDAFLGPKVDLSPEAIRERSESSTNPFAKGIRDAVGSVQAQGGYNPVLGKDAVAQAAQKKVYQPLNKNLADAVQKIMTDPRLQGYELNADNLDTYLKTEEEREAFEEALREKYGDSEASVSNLSTISRPMESGGEILRSVVFTHNGKNIEIPIGLAEDWVAQHNAEVQHNEDFREDPEYRNQWFLSNMGISEQTYRNEVAADLENRLHELRKKVVATLPAQHTRGGYAAIGAAANKPSSGAPVSIEKIDKALKTVNTLRKNSFGAGLKEGFDLADILTLGISGIGENVALLNALNKSASGKTLTTSEQALVEAWDIQNEAEEVIDTLGGRRRGANIGYGVSQSLGFMTQTAGTGGVASFATKGIGRAAARVALRRATNMGVNKSIKEGLRYGGLKVAESAVGAAARTPFMGFTYRNYTDKRLNQFQVNERVDEATGEISKYIDKQEASALRDVAHAVLESYFENQSEDVGGLIDFGITSFARALPLKGLLRNRAAEALRGPVKNGAMKWIKEGVKLHSIIGEMLSEAYGDAMVNLLTANNEGWKHMASSEYWWELLGVSSMLSGGFWVANKGVNFLAYKDERKAINKNLKQRKESLSRIEDDNLKKELTEATLTDDVIDRSKRLSSLDWSNFSREDMANAVDFIDAQTRLDVMREGATESRRLARIMPAIDEVKKLADGGALDDEQAAASLATIYSDLFRTQENQRALNILTDRIKVAADAGISADKINDILRGAGLTVFNPGDEIETLTGDRAIVDKVLPGAYEVVNNEGNRAVVSFEEVLQNTPEVRQIQQESNQTEGQPESALENNPQVEQAVADARAQVAEIINKDDSTVYEVETDDGITGYIIGGKGIVVDNDGRINQSAEDTVVVKTDEGNRVVHKERVKVKNHQTLQEIEDLARGAAEGALAAVQPQQPDGGKTYQGIYDNEPVTITLPREIKFNEDGTVDYDNLMNPETVSVIRPNGAVVDEVGLNEIEQLTEVQPEAEQVSADAPAVKQQEVTNLEPDFSAIRPVSIGDFGPIYDQFRGNAKDAIALLLQRKDGEAVGALSHPEVGEIDLVWGREGTSKSDGYGLSKLAKYHPEVLENLQEILNDMKVASRTENRVQLESDTHKASVRLTWNEQKKNWLLTAFEKKEASASIGKKTDTDDNPKDLRGDTALSQNTDALSDNKDTTSEPNNQEVAQKNVTETAPIVQQPQIPLLKNGEPDYNAMDARMFAEQYVTRFGEGATERIARNNIKASNKTISTIEKQIEDVTDPNKMPALYSKLQDAQATKDKYSAVLEELGLSADESEDNAARIQRKKQENTPWFNKLFPDGFPNVESVILWDIANGNRIRWANKEVNGAVVSKGLGSHLGLADSNAERTRRVALIGKDAPTPEEYAEQLPERLNAMGLRFEESELLDKVIAVYTSVDTVRKAKEELEKISANIQAEQEGLDYEEEQMRRNYEREQEALRQEAQADVVDEQVEQEQPTNEEPQEEELSIEDEVPFMVSSDSVQATNEAQKLATEAAITALENAGVEVVNATPEMVEEALQRKDVQLQAVNQKFNEQLDSFTEENATSVVFDLGMPSPILLAGGVADKPIKLYGNKLLKKIRKHGLNLEELKGLPIAIANPIAIFDNYRKSGNRSVLTELKTKDGNILVSIEIGKGVDIDFDMVKSVFGKDDNGVLNWINKGYLTFVDKEKALGYLYPSAPIAATANSQELDSATKIVENFENPNFVPANSFAVENPSLVGLHNISEEKLRKAFRLGGLANPSVAVIDSNSQKHTGYGDITLVLPSAMIAKKTGKNIGTYFGDAWTPTYPEVQKQLGNNRASQDIMELPDEMQNSVRLALNSWLDGRSGDSLSYMFLHQRGDAPEIHRTQAEFSPELHEAMTQITGGQDFYYLNDEDRNRVLDLYIQEKHDGSRDKFNAHMRRVIERGNRLIEERGENSLIGRKAKEAIDAINEYGYDYDSVSGFVRDVHRDMEYSGKVDPQYTLLLAERKVKENGLESAFAQWLDSLEDRYAIKEVIFKGYTPSGNRRYIPNTLENASKEMRLQGRAGAAGLSIGFSNFAARLLQPGVTLDDIRKRKRQLKTSIEEVDAFKDKWSSVMFDLGEKCQPNATGYEDYGLERLAEAATKNDPQAYLKSEYGVDLSDEDVKRLKDMVKAIRTEYPVMYFETKFERPVYFNEFAGAVVPDNTSVDVVQSLKDAGIPVWTYAASDENARMDAIKNIANSSNDIFFSIGPAPVFVSNAKIAVLGIKQEKATPEQWLKMIEKAGGMKAGEDKWIGLSDWLKASDKKTLTKQEVLDYINENQIQIEETTYSSNDAAEVTPEFKALRDEFERLTREIIADSDDKYNRLEAQLSDKYGFTDVFDVERLSNEEYLELSGLMISEQDAMDMAFSQMKEDYGDDFDIAFWLSDTIRVDNAEAAGILLGLPIDRPIYHIREDFTTKGLEGNREIALTVPTIEPWNANDEVHFGDAGEGRAIAWIRFGETTDEDGKRVLVIDEIQSKRHQEGRERGYGFVGDVAKAREDADEAYRKVVSFENDMTSKYGDQYWTGDATNEEVAHWELLRSELDRLGLIYENIAEKQRKSVPEAPFEKNWAELAMKRMLRYAAENGFDKVAWTKGDQQAERYSLGAVLQGLKAYKTSPNTYYVIPYNNGVIGEFVKEYTEKELADTFGKELAAKIIANTENATEDNPYEIEGDGLRIGGEGMRAFYDQMLPSFMRKYGKKWGATVQDVTLPYVEEAGRTMRSVDVTDSMRESVMQGQPMFYRRPNGTVYGWTNGTTVYLTESGMNPNTPIHEYTHIWAAAMKKHNPEGWKSIVKLLKGTPVWNEVMADTNYANIHSSENQVASEALSRISGRENSAKMEAMAQQMIDENANDTVKKNRARKLLDRMRKSLQEFWSWVGKELFGIKNFESIEQVTDRILYDLVSGTDLAATPSLAGQVKAVIDEYDNADEVFTINDVAERISEVVNNYTGTESTTELENILEDFEEAQNSAGRYGYRMDSGGEDAFEEALRAYVAKAPIGGFSIQPQERAEIIRAAKANDTYLKAPNGKDTNLTPEQWVTVRTKAFKRWFGDWENDPENASKVVDENGEPMIMYHGSVSDSINVFDKSKIRASETDADYNGFWFSSDANTSPAWRAANKVYAVYLNVKKPIIRRDTYKVTRELRSNYKLIENLVGENKEIRSLQDATRYELQRQGHDGIIDFTSPLINEEEFVSTGQTVFVMADGYAHILSKKGDEVILYEYDPYVENHEGNVEGVYDSLEEFYDDSYYFGETVYVAFEPNQIKLAEGNTTFDPDNDDIRFNIERDNESEDDFSIVEYKVTPLARLEEERDALLENRENNPNFEQEYAAIEERIREERETDRVALTIVDGLESEAHRVAVEDAVFDYVREHNLFASQVYVERNLVDFKNRITQTFPGTDVSKISDLSAGFYSDGIIVLRSDMCDKRTYAEAVLIHEYTHALTTDLLDDDSYYERQLAIAKEVGADYMIERLYPNYKRLEIEKSDDGLVAGLMEMLARDMEFVVRNGRLTTFLSSESESDAVLREYFERYEVPTPLAESLINIAKQIKTEKYGEEIDRRTHSEGEFVSTDTEWDNGTNLQPNARTDGERRYPGWFGTRTGATGTAPDEGGQVGGGTRADRADLAESQPQAQSGQENALTPQEDKAKDKALKQLDRLNKVINSLRQTVKQAERDNVDLANVVQAALEEEVKDGGINRFLDVPELISLIRSGLDKKSIESTMDRLSERLTDAIIKNREEQLAQLLQVQVQGTNAFGIPIGYAVDDDTRAMVEFFRENLSRDMNKIVEAMASEDDKSLKPYNKSELNVWFTAYKEIEESRYNIKATQKDIDHETERSQSFYRLTKELKAKNAPEGQIKTAQEHRRQALRNKKAQKKAILVAKQTLAQELEGMIFLLGGRLRDGRAIRAGRLSADKVYAKNFLTEAMTDVRVNDGTKTFQGTKEELTAKAKFHKDIRVRTAAYRSYAYMIQSVSRNAIGGKGFLWDALMEGKNGWVDCNDKRLAMDNIDNQEILANVQASGLKSVADLQRLFDKQLVDKNGNPYVFRYETDRTGRIDQDIRPTIGWATYIVLCFEQDDMAPTMEKMRITEEQIQQIRDMLPEAAKNFLKWSRKMLEDRRQRIYNPASLERFGTQMANIPNYFPIRRLEKNLHKVEEVEQVASADSDQVTIMANALIKRVRNVVEIDFQQNPLELLKNHLERMNGFAANVPLARNVNILLNSSGFRDQLNEQGDPNTYEYFKTAAKVALSSYKPKPGALDSVMIELQGWLAAGKIAWRFFTALKQLLSLPAFWSYNVSLRYKAIFIRSVLWPAVKNGDEGKLVAIWKWGMDNIPQLKERWSSRYAGNEKLAQVKDTLFAQYIAKHALLRNTVGKIGEWGMIPNASVDLFACSIGCYAVYKFELEQLQKKGYPKEEADELAKRRASIAFNESQQSSESAFIAPLQRDRTFLAVQVSLFNNSNFGYGRKEKLARKYLWQQTFNKDLREKRLALAKKRYLERFLNEERNRLVENNNKIADVTKRLRPEEIDRMVESKRAEFSKRAEKEANRDAKMAYAKGVEDAVMFKWLLNMAWQMAPTAVAYWLSCAMREGDDEDPQNPLNAETLALMFATATFRNAIGGGVFESALNGYGFTGLVGSEVEKTVDILAQALQPLWLTDEEAESFDPLAVWMAVKQCLVMGTGFDVNVFTNIFTGLVGLFNDRSRTTADVLRILNAPKSMIREIEIVPFEDETLDNYTRRMAMMENVALDRMEELKEKPSSELNATERRELRKMKKWEKNLITIRQAEAAGVPYSREVDGRVVAAELKQLDADYADLLKSLDLTQSGKNRAGKVELTEDERRRKKALRVVTRVKGIRKMEESAAEVINNPEAYRNAYRQIVEEKRTLIEEWNQ